MHKRAIQRTYDYISLLTFLWGLLWVILEGLENEQGRHTQYLYDCKAYLYFVGSSYTGLKKVLVILTRG